MAVHIALLAAAVGGEDGGDGNGSGGGGGGGSAAAEIGEGAEGRQGAPPGGRRAELGRLPVAGGASPFKGEPPPPHGESPDSVFARIAADCVLLLEGGSGGGGGGNGGGRREGCGGGAVAQMSSLSRMKLRGLLSALFDSAQASVLAPLTPPPPRRRHWGRHC